MKTESTMTDSMGNTVPLRYVSAYDKARDAGVRRIHARWIKARSYMERVMTKLTGSRSKHRRMREKSC
jgi:hypothetical protein